MSFQSKNRIPIVWVLVILVQFALLAIILFRVISLERNVISLSKLYTEYYHKTKSEPQQVNFATGEEFVLGDENAPITMAIIFNYDCPHCIRFFNETFPGLNRDYIQNGLVKIAFNDHPPEGIPNAFRKSEAALCAMDQDKYLEFTNLLIKENGSGKHDENFFSIAEITDLNIEQFYLCLDNGEKRQLLEDQVIHTRQLGVLGTPSLIINQELYLGFKSYDDLKTILESQIKK